jgi:hypothetical protein
LEQVTEGRRRVFPSVSIFIFRTTEGNDMYERPGPVTRGLQQ